MGISNDNEQQRIDELTKQIKQTKVDAAIQEAFIKAGVIDVDYLTYKLKEKGEPIELDEQGNIKGLNETLSGFKAKYPFAFAPEKQTVCYEGFRPMAEVDESLQNQDLTKAEILKLPYAEQAKIFENNPERYRAIMMKG